jgi:hypothetical protein
LLSPLYLKEFSKELTDYFIDIHGNTTILFLQLAKNYFDIKKILKEENLFEDIIDTYLKDEKYEYLKFITDTFNLNDVKKYYKKDDDKTKVIEDRLKDIYKKVTDEKKVILEEIAKMLGIKI